MRNYSIKIEKAFALAIGTLLSQFNEDGNVSTENKDAASLLVEIVREWAEEEPKECAVCGKYIDSQLSFCSEECEDMYNNC